MVAQTQADRIAMLGQSVMKVPGLCHFTETLKADFKSILLEALAADGGEAATVQRAADLCAERCQEKLLQHINGRSALGDVVTHALNLPRTSRIKKQSKESQKPCTFFDLASGDEFDDESTSASSSSSVSDNEDAEDSIEFMFGEGFLTINFNEDAELQDDNTKLQKGACQMNSTGCVKPAGGRLTRKDLASLYQNIKSLREEFETTKAKPVHVASLFAKPTATSDSRFPKSFRAQQI